MPSHWTVSICPAPTSPHSRSHSSFCSHAGKVQTPRPPGTRTRLVLWLSCCEPDFHPLPTLGLFPSSLRNSGPAASKPLLSSAPSPGGLASCLLGPPAPHRRGAHAPSSPPHPHLPAWSTFSPAAWSWPAYLCAETCAPHVCISDLDPPWRRSPRGSGRIAHPTPRARSPLLAPAAVPPPPRLQALEPHVPPHLSLLLALSGSPCLPSPGPCAHPMRATPASGLVRSVLVSFTQRDPPPPWDLTSTRPSGWPTVLGEHGAGAEVLLAASQSWGAS